MAQGTRKEKIVRLLQIFFEETDQDHGLTMPQLIERLEDYGICAERKGLYDDIEVLNNCGFEIEKLRTRPVQYALTTRLFEDEQIGVLIDSVQSSLALTRGKTDGIINAILSLVPKYKRDSVLDQSMSCAIAKKENDLLFYSIDSIKQALIDKRKIRFHYFRYNLNKRFEPSKDEDGKVKVYMENPVSLAYVNDLYYLITYNDMLGEYRTYRIDRMKDVEVMSEPRTRNDKIANFDVAQYLSKTINMFPGEKEVPASLLVNEVGLRLVIDRFGADVRTSTRSTPEGWVRVFINVGMSPTLYSWLCGMGTDVKIEGPSELVQRYRAHLKEIQDSYLPRG